MRTSPAQAASGPEASGQIRPSPSSEAATAAGRAPAVGAIWPSSPNSPNAIQPFSASGGRMPMTPIMARAMGRS